METPVPDRLPRIVFWSTVLLWLGTGVLGHIDPTKLSAIIDYITHYGVEEQYAFAVSLKRVYCRHPSRLREELPTSDLRKMRDAIRNPRALYNPTKGHIVAARVNRLPNGAAEHTEWRLLQGGQNSPVQKLLARTYNTSSCLIFFTLNSPCAGTCLRENGPYNILKMVSKTFHKIKTDYKAFVFRQIYELDRDRETRQSLLQAWHRLHHVPLLRCNNNGCRSCARKETRNYRNPCLSGMKADGQLLHPPDSRQQGEQGAPGTVEIKLEGWGDGRGYHLKAVKMEE